MPILARGARADDDCGRRPIAPRHSFPRLRSSSARALTAKVVTIPASTDKSFPVRSTRGQHRIRGIAFATPIVLPSSARSRVESPGCRGCCRAAPMPIRRCLNSRSSRPFARGCRTTGWFCTRAGSCCRVRTAGGRRKARSTSSCSIPHANSALSLSPPPTASAPRARSTSRTAPSAPAPAERSAAARRLRCFARARLR